MNKTTVLSISILVLALPLTRAEEHARTKLRIPELAAQPQVATTPEHRQEIVTTPRSFEKDPFRIGAPLEREKALWTIDHAPDIFPSINHQFSTEITVSGVPDWRSIYAQFIFGFVSFQIEHPEKADDPVAVYQAALESCLQVYRKAPDRDGNNRVAILDTVSEHERKGMLKKYVEQFLAELPSHRSK